MTCETSVVALDELPDEPPDGLPDELPCLPSCLPPCELAPLEELACADELEPDADVACADELAVDELAADELAADELSACADSYFCVHDIPPSLNRCAKLVNDFVKVVLRAPYRI